MQHLDMYTDEMLATLPASPEIEQEIALREQLNIDAVHKVFEPGQKVVYAARWRGFPVVFAPLLPIGTVGVVVDCRVNTVAVMFNGDEDGYREDAGETITLYLPKYTLVRA